MADVQHLLPLIYHERQQSGSLLCAQHALNSLLQGNYFTAPDLSELARHIDDLEHSYNEDTRGQASANMDDTGFFSVQVLENALQVWGLSLARWRSEAMKSYQDRPHIQLAFVLNQNQHWYTLRRFGAPAESGHWFNLDSGNSSPQWISKTYLGMFLQQAEQEGYSIFVVVSIDPSNIHPLPQCEADDAASNLSEPPGLRSLSSDSTLEDEDMDLQAALQASLANAEQGGSRSSIRPLDRLDNYLTPVIPSPRTFPGFAPDVMPSEREGTSRRQSNIPPNQDPHGNADVDPVTASMERNRIIMERMRQEQEVALREQYEEEITRFGQTRRRETEEEDEDELFRKAMEESLAEHRALAGEDRDAEIAEQGSDDDEDYHTPPSRLNTHTMDRVYDDDDAQLQAALKASLESVPPGFTLPPSPPPQPPQRLTPPQGLTSEPSSAKTRVVEERGSETETETETETDTEGVSGGKAPVPKEELSVEEMRRRRLARFGG